MSLKTDLEAILSPHRVLTRPIDRVAYASDASLYRLIPQAVVQPKSVQEVQALFAYSRAQHIPLTFRAAGTSLSGQSVTDGILVDVSRFFRGAKVEQQGETIRLAPGVIGSDANQVLKPYHRRIGPDPASIDAAMIGGMVANNASGMCCGVIENSYHTLVSLTFTLPNGLTLNTADPSARQTFETQAPEIARGLMALRQQILAQPALLERIRSKYRQKNTTGYSLNAFIDYNEPQEILSHLLVGSEGTLGFISEVVLQTLPSYPLKYTGLLLFGTIQAAARAVYPLGDSGARAIEFMDRAALRSVENEPGISDLLHSLPEGAAGLLVEYQGTTPSEMETYQKAAEAACLSIQLLRPVAFTSDPLQQANLWKIRKGLYPSIGGMRRPGTTVLIEDVTFPVAQLAEAATDLQALFVKHNYPEAIIFGHAKDGNLHFVLTPSFNSQASIRQYADFMDDVVALVVEKYHGALKAEHGTGRNVAPFVETEWGSAAYQIMLQVKALIDPENLLNPGVILNSDPHAHLKDLKPWPIVEEEVNKCIECGFCEPKCPSRDLTLSPRQRIVVRREIARLTASGDAPAALASLLDDYQYSGNDTCAVDGYCAIACPVHINTGLLTKRLRAEQISPRGQSTAVFLSRHFKHLEGDLRLAVGLGHLVEGILGVKGLTGVSRLGEKILRTPLPKWNRVVPRATFKPLPKTSRSAAEIVYFPSCIARVMGSGPGKEDPTLVEVFQTLARRAGIQLWIPPDSPGNCCGMPFSSKGYVSAFRETLHRTVSHFWDWSDGGRLPVVIDSSSCAYTLLTSQDALSPGDREKWEQLILLDPVEFACRHLLPHLTLHKLDAAVVLHPNCSAVKLGLQEQMLTMARACATSVTVPYHLKCCGFAGDRGLLFPELTASASRLEAAEVQQTDYAGYYSSNLTCEMGMSLATGKPYRSILYLVEEASR